MPPKIHGRNTQDVVVPGIGTPTYKDLRKVDDARCSAGIFEGGLITDSGSGQIDVSAAKGMIRSTNSELGELFTFDIAALANISLTDNSMNYLYIDYNAGNPIWVVTTDYDSINLHSQVIVGRVYRFGFVLYISNVGQDIQDATLRDMYRLQTLRRMEHATGSMLGFVAATRQPTISAGVYFSNYAKISTAVFDASGTDRFVAWYRNGSGGWLTVTGVQNIDNLYYDDGDGSLAELATNNYGIHWVYQLVDGSIHIQYGQASYTLANARLALAPVSQPPPVVGVGILIGRIIIFKNATTIYEVASAFTTTFSGAAATNHNDLTGIQGGASNEYYHLSIADYAVRNIPVVEVTSATQAMAIRTRYVANYGSQLVFTLPASAVIGDFVEVEGYGAGGWRISQNVSQTVIFQTVATTVGTGGYLASGNRYDCIRLRCVVANTTWTVVSAVGEITVI